MNQNFRLDRFLDLEENAAQESLSMSIRYPNTSNVVTLQRLVLWFCALILICAPGCHEINQGEKLWNDSKENEGGLLRQFLEKGEQNMKSGAYGEALAFFKISLDLSRKSRNKRVIAHCLNGIAAATLHLGQYGETLQYSKEALEMGQKYRFRDVMLSSTNTLALAFSSLGNDEKALKYFKDAMLYAAEIEDTNAQDTILGNMAYIYIKLGKYNEALEYLNRSLKHSKSFKKGQERRLAMHRATIYTGMGLVYYYLGTNKLSLQHFKKALRIFEQCGNLWMAGIVYANLGHLYLELKDYKEAEAAFKNQERMMTDLDAGQWFLYNPGLVELLIDLEKYEEAYEALIQNPPSYATEDFLALYYTQKAAVLSGLSKLREAARNFLKAFKIHEQNRAQLRLDHRSGYLMAQDRIRSYRGLVSVLSELALKGELEDPEFSKYGKNLGSSAYYFSEATKARTLLEAIVEYKKPSEKYGIPRSLSEKETYLTNRLRLLEKKWEYALQTGGTTLESIKKERRGIYDELDKLIADFRENYPRYAALYYPQPIAPEKIPLNNHEVIIEFAFGIDTGYIFRVQKGGLKQIYRISSDIVALRKKVISCISPMLNGRRDEFSLDMANELYNLLLSDVFQHVSKDDKIIIIPDGILCLLPFEALVIKKGKSFEDTLFVSDEYTLRYYQSSTILALQRMLASRSTDKRLFALGNPIFGQGDKEIKNRDVNGKNHADLRGVKKIAFTGLSTRYDKGNLNFTPLPETEDEIYAIAEILDIDPNPPDVLTSHLANESGLKGIDLKRYRYIHFATHADTGGKIQGINEPFILLGQIGNEEEDGFLKLSEVMHMNIRAEMVVLSACRTGRGKYVEGEGVINFARAFHQAGAKNVVVSLWKVSSKETVEFMKTFYSNIKIEEDLAKALNRTRREVRQRYRYPLYWAAFILHGEG